MRISESAVAMQSSFASVRAERTTLEIRRTPPPPREPLPALEKPQSKGDLELSRDFKTYLLKLLVEWLSGEKIDDPELDAETPSEEPVADAPAARPQIELHYERTRYEAERVDFRAQGVVTTADGRKISLDLQVGMSREHFERVAVDAGGKPLAKDPLVLNFNAATTALGGKKISFDLDLDGTADQVRLPAAGSAFLALDRNHNGRVDDGSELFGATTGNGFAELAAARRRRRRLDRRGRRRVRRPARLVRRLQAGLAEGRGGRRDQRERRRDAVHARPQRRRGDRVRPLHGPLARGKRLAPHRAADRHRGLSIRQPLARVIAARERLVRPVETPKRSIPRPPLTSTVQITRFRRKGTSGGEAGVSTRSA